MTDAARKNVTEWLAGRFEAERPRLQRMAARMLGSVAEAEDALQESWLRASRADVTNVEALEGWLTTVTARVCLDALNRRKTRREDLTPDDPRSDLAASAPGERPEEEAALADAIGTAMLILLDALTPAERVAFVLHDMFDVPFDDIAKIVDKTPEAARQLASRARRRVRGASNDRADDVTQRHGELVRAFLEASRAGNFSALLMLLDPQAALRADAAALAMGGSSYFGGALPIQGAQAIAQTFSGRARAALPALIDGTPGAVWMHENTPRVAFRFTFAHDRITGIHLVADPDALAHMAIARS